MTKGHEGDIVAVPNMDMTAVCALPCIEFHDPAGLGECHVQCVDVDVDFLRPALMDAPAVVDGQADRDT